MAGREQRRNESATVPVGVQIRLAGRIRAEIDGTDVAIEPFAKLGQLGRIALAYLVLERSRPVARGQLGEVLWGEDLPPTWAAALRGIVARVRAAILACDPAATLSSVYGCYELHLSDTTTVDVESFERSVLAIRSTLSTSPGDAFRAARDVAELCGQDFLPGSGDSDWADLQRDRLRATRLDALEVAAGAALSAGCPDDAVSCAMEAIRLDELRESSYRLLMRAHAQAGNRAAALRAYEQCRRTLAEQLGVTPAPHTEEEYLSMLGDSGLAEGEHGPTPVNRLPVPLTSFVGRATEIATVKERLRSSRLVTLTGPAGIGKSHLALRVASDVVSFFRHGVSLVDVGGVVDERSLPEFLVGALRLDEQGAGPTEALVSHLRGEERLIVLDNCDQATDWADLLRTLLAACPQLHVLATSRVPFAVAGESRVSVPPLDTPEDRVAATLPKLLQYDSVRLFVERVRAVAPDIVFEDDLTTLLRISVRLEGVPLAIELAAAHARFMSLRDILAGLEDQLRFLVSDAPAGISRHRALSAAILSTLENLTERERLVFARLSVFVGGFHVDAAVDVCGVPLQTMMGLIGALVEKSLLAVQRTPEATRYKMLDAIRAHGWTLLADGENIAALTRRHIEWAIGLVERSEEGLRGPDQVRWVTVLDDEYGNVRAGWLRATEMRDSEAVARIAGSLWRYWEIRGQYAEGMALLSEVVRSPALSDAVRAKALTSLAILFERQCQFDAAQQCYQQSAETWKACGGIAGYALAVNGLANCAIRARDLATARAYLEENLSVCAGLGDDHLRAATLLNLGVMSHVARSYGQQSPTDGDSDPEPLYEEALELYQALQDHFGQALALENLGSLAAVRGDFDVAIAMYTDCLALRRQLDHKPGVAAAARALSQLLLRHGAYAVANELQAESLQIERQLGHSDRIARTLEAVAELASQQGDFERAWSTLTEAAALYRELGDDASLARSLSLKGDVATARGDVAGATIVHRQAYAAAQRWGDPTACSLALIKLARSTLARGDAEHALRLCREALAPRGADIEKWLLPPLARVVADIWRSEGRMTEADDLVVAADAVAALDTRHGVSGRMPTLPSGVVHRNQPSPDPISAGHVIDMIMSA